MNLRLLSAARRSAVALEEGQRILIGPVTLLARDSGLTRLVKPKPPRIRLL